MNKKTDTYFLADIPQIAKKLKKLLSTHPILTFTGSLGSGKTTLVKELLRQCGVHEAVTSPTFTYVNQYTNDRGHQFYHFDLYRIANLNDFRAAGFDEYLYVPNSFVFVEWPEKIMPLLQEKVCHVHLDYGTVPDERQLYIECIK